MLPWRKRQVVGEAWPRPSDWSRWTWWWWVPASRGRLRRRLAQHAPKLRIVCLERGGWVDPASMPAWHRHWQRTALGAWATSPNLRLNPACQRPRPIIRSTTAIGDIKPLMWNGVGGSTINWAAHFPRLHPSDFRTRSLDGVGEDWPFGYFDLEPYYDQNDIEIGVSGLAGDPAYPPKPPRPCRRLRSAGLA